MVARLEGNARRQAPAGGKGRKKDAGRDGNVQAFRFADFNQAFAFMNQIALKAERMDRRPEESEVYNRASVLPARQACGTMSRHGIDSTRFVGTLAS